MKAIQTGDRGAAVADIQRRLRVLGYDLGSTGVDGVFLESTRAAVQDFQRSARIEPTGSVGPRTWSVLVDSTFELGDRMLYLRFPYFHGADVTQLQAALNSLGFATGGADGIFGSYTERAVAEFQANSGLDADGLVGAETFQALFALRHLWSDKEGAAHSGARAAPHRRWRVLERWRFVFEAEVPAALRLARRANNLVEAACGAEVQTAACAVYVQLALGEEVAGSAAEPAAAELAAGSSGRETAEQSAANLSVVAYQADHHLLAEALCVACQFRNKVPPRISILVPAEALAPGSEPSPQHMARVLLDALCMAFEANF
jgi:hypothetical protein